MLFSSIRTSTQRLLSCAEFSHLYNPLNLQSIRWSRKPRWLPVAKSKKFRIPVKPQIPPEELLEIRTLYNHYKTEMNSLRFYFLEKTKELLTGKDVIAERVKLEEEEHQKCLQLNEQWNTKIAILREERIAKEKDEELKQIEKIIEENKIKAQKTKQKLEAIVRKEKELSKHYITPNNIDEALERALSSEVDYDFSIDLSGNIFKGRNAAPISPNSVETKKVEETSLQ